MIKNKTQLTIYNDIFSTNRVASDPKQCSPLVVVGLPRSGSSFLSHILSQFENYYVFDDLYLLQHAKYVGIKDKITQDMMNKILFYLGWQIRARLRHSQYALPNVGENEVEDMNAAIAKAFDGYDPSVLELQAEWLTRLAHRKGAQKWGFKMPKAFFEIERLQAYHPKIKVIFLMRQPHDVLASYKFMTESVGDGDSARYHPIIYSYYWRIAARKLLSLQKSCPEDVLFVDFKDLTNSPTTVSHRIAGFLDEVPPDFIAQPTQVNSSYDSKSTRKEITGLENWIVNRACRREMEALGFESRSSPLSMMDIVDFLITSARTLRFRIWDQFRTRRARVKRANRIT